MARSAEGGEQQAAAFIARLRTVSPEFTEAAVHIARALRGQFLDIAGAAQAGGIAAVMTKLDALKESPLIVGLTSSLHWAADTVSSVLDELKKLGPLAEFVGGMTVMVAGFFTGPTIGTALAAALVLAGFVIAMNGAANMLFPAQQANGLQ